jgi:hypothetical protein
MRRLAASFALLFACANCDKPVRPDDARIGSLLVSPGGARLVPGDSIRISVTARDSNGVEVADAAVTWSSQDAALAAVSSSGVVRAGSLGAATADTTWVVATAGSIRDSARIVVAIAGLPGAPRMGINLAAVTDWSTEFPFANVFHTSRYWIPQRDGAAWGTGGTLALSAEHWVNSLESGQYATTIVLNDATGHQPAGDYVLLYDGDGDLRFEINQNVSVVSQAPGRMVVRVPSGTGGVVFLNLRRTNASNPVRNIRFLRPGTEASYRAQPFAEDFLRVARQFGVQRFMEWQRTNQTQIAEWSDRATPAFATFAGPWGVSPETMIALANETGADPWFCMSHLASDDYVRQFATLVRTQLGSRQRVYVEYSNEVWNSIFPQATYVLQRGQALGLSTNAGQAALRFYSQRAVEIFAIWRQVFGADSARVVRVLASQAANSWTAEQVLSWQDAFRHADAIAIAPYFGGTMNSGDGSSQAGMSETQVLDALASEIEGPIRGFIEANAQVARTYGVRLVAYEGGQHLVSAYMSPANEPAVTRLFHAVNRNARMGDLYRRYFEIWYEAGGELFLPYHDADAWSRYGSWGALEYVHQDPASSPKYQAILDAAARFSAFRR